jgi:hypothetical protein
MVNEIVLRTTTKIVKMFLECFLLLSFYFGMINSIIKDKYISQCLLTLPMMLVVFHGYFTLTTLTAEQVYQYGSFLLAFYTFESLLYLFTNMAHKYSMIIHHMVTLKLIVSHMTGILPPIIGGRFFVLFETSNMFLLPWQMCHKKGWITARNILSYPLFITYVPIRLIGIPMYTLTKYTQPLWHMYILYPYHSVYMSLLFIAVNVFSVYYAVYVTKKFVKFLRRERITID